MVSSLVGTTTPMHFSNANKSTSKKTAKTDEKANKQNEPDYSLRNNDQDDFVSSLNNQDKTTSDMALKNAGSLNKLHQLLSGNKNIEQSKDLQTQQQELNTPVAETVKDSTEPVANNQEKSLATANTMAQNIQDTQSNPEVAGTVAQNIQDTQSKPEVAGTVAQNIQDTQSKPEVAGTVAQNIQNIQPNYAVATNSFKTSAFEQGDNTNSSFSKNDCASIPSSGFSFGALTTAFLGSETTGSFSGTSCASSGTSSCSSSSCSSSGGGCSVA